MNYPVTKIGTKSQIVIPKKIRDLVWGVNPGDEVMIIPEADNSVRIRPLAANWAEENRGSLRGTWGKDPTKYIKKLREEWN